MSIRRLLTVSLPPPLLTKADRIAREENRTKSELVREALRFYVEARDIRSAVLREQVLRTIDRVQERTARVPRRDIRRIIREAIKGARSRGPRRTA